MKRIRTFLVLAFVSLLPGPGLAQPGPPGGTIYAEAEFSQVTAAAAAGQISIGPVVRRFECPLIPAKP